MAELFKKKGNDHEPISSHPPYVSVLDANDPSIVNQPDYVAKRIDLYKDLVISQAAQDDTWTFGELTPDLLVKWLLPSAEWKAERASYFPKTKETIFKALMTSLQNLQSAATGMDKDALLPPAVEKVADRKVKDSTDFKGLPIAIEYPVGSTRKGTAPDGTKWERPVIHAYGYIKKTDGADGDSVDMYMGPDEDADHVYVVNQLHPDGAFDEHKALLGFSTAHDALTGYLAHMPDDWTQFGPLQSFTLAEFKHWLTTGDLSKTASAEPQSCWVVASEEALDWMVMGTIHGVKQASSEPLKPKPGEVLIRMHTATFCLDNNPVPVLGGVPQWVLRSGSLHIPRGSQVGVIPFEKVAEVKQRFVGRATVTQLTAGHYDPSTAKPGKLLSENPKYRGQHVLIYRGLPEAAGPMINPNDYVCLGRRFAEEHAETTAVYEEEPCIAVKATVPAEHVAEAYNPGEYFYVGPQPIKGRVIFKYDPETGEAMKLAAGQAPTVTEDGDQIIFSIGDSEAELEMVPDQHRAIVKTIWVSEKSHGLGTQLMQSLVGWCKEHGIKYLTGLDVSEHGESTKIRKKLPGQTVTLRRKSEGDAGPGADTLFPEAEGKFRQMLKGLVPDETGHVLVTRIAAALRAYRMAAASNGPDAGEHGATTDGSGQFWGDAGAGCVFLAQDTGRLLVSFRSEFVNEPHTWGVWGGAIDGKENAARAALREVREETGYRGQVHLKEAYVYTNGKFKYTTFLAIVPKEFVPRLDWETEDFQWCDREKIPTPTHFGLKEALPSLVELADEVRPVGSKENAELKDALGQTEHKTAGFSNRAWISPEGEIHAVPGDYEGDLDADGYEESRFRHHPGVAQSLGLSSTTLALAKGWARVGTYTQWDRYGSYIEVRKLTDAQLHAFQQMLMRNPPPEGRTPGSHTSVAFEGQFNGRIPYEEFLTLDHVSDVARAMVGAKTASIDYAAKWEEMKRDRLSPRQVEEIEAKAQHQFFTEDEVRARAHQHFQASVIARYHAKTAATIENGVYSMPLSEAVDEHEGLTDALRSPNKTDDKEALKEQGAELQEMQQAQSAQMENFYDLTVRILHMGTPTFDEFVHKLQGGAGSQFPDYLKAAGGYTGLRHIWDETHGSQDQDAQQSLDSHRISPRKPSASPTLRGKPREVPLEDVHAENKLQPDLESMARDPETFAHNIGLMLEYPNFGGIKRANATIPQKAEMIISQMEDNLIWLYNHWSPDFRKRTKLWYVGGNRLIHRWTKRFNADPHQVAAVIAALSPQQPWFQNITLAERVLSAVKEHPDFKWDDKMTKLILAREWGSKPSGKLPSAKSMLPELQGKSINDLRAENTGDSLYKQSVWVRAWDEAHNPNKLREVSPEGEFGDWDRTDKGAPAKVQWKSFAMIGKAIKAIESPTAREISDIVGENHKVRSFYNNLIAPHSKGGDVTIDTHAVAAALLRPLSAASREVTHNFGGGLTGERGTSDSNVTGATGLYGIYAEAYRRAAQKLGVQPRELQSITWEAVRGLFEAKIKGTKGQETQDLIQQTWEDVSNGKRNAANARERISDLAGGISTPSWSRSHSAGHEVQRDSSYAGELPGHGASGSEPGGLPGGAGSGTPGRAASARVARPEQRNTPEFKAWFGDSKIVDKAGNPLVLYRGIARMPEGMPPGAMRCEPRPGYAVFCTDNPHVASTYGDALVPIYVKADQLIEFPSKDGSFSFCGFDDRAKSLGPGQVLVVRQVYDAGPRNREHDTEKLYSYKSDIYAFGRGTQVKSAIGNNGKFDSDPTWYSLTSSQSPRPKARLFQRA